jgi:hypothetical protein
VFHPSSARLIGTTTNHLFTERRAIPLPEGSWKDVPLHWARDRQSGRLLLGRENSRPHMNSGRNMNVWD